MGLGIAILVNGEFDAELSEPASIEIIDRIGEPITYRIRYPVDIVDDDLSLLTDDRLSANSELAIVTEVDGTTIYLVKGPVYGQQIHLEHSGTGSYVDVLGSDNTLKMDRENKAVIWADGTDSDAVSTILESQGFDSDIEDTPAAHPEAKHALIQRESDLRFVRRLARRNGYLFWLTYDDEGNETAHFKRPSLDEEPDLEFKINLDPPDIQALNLEWDVERPTSVIASQLDLNTKEVFDGGTDPSPLKSLGSQDFSAIAGSRSSHISSPMDDLGDLKARSEATLIEAGFFLKATCQTTRAVLTKVIQSHSLVKVRGAGSRYSGTWFCSGVYHKIDENGHGMDIELIRNAWGS